MVWLAMGISISSVDICSAGYRRDVFVQDHCFDAAAFHTVAVEDQEFSFRLAARGHRLVFLPEAIVYHQRLTSATRYFRRNYNIGYWKMCLLRRYPGKAMRDSHTPRLIKVQIVLAGAALVGALEMFRPSIGLWIACGLSILPLLSKIARRDPPVLLIAPIMIFIRTLALGLGLFSGALRFYLFRFDRPPA